MLGLCITAFMSEVRAIHALVLIILCMFMTSVISIYIYPLVCVVKVIPTSNAKSVFIVFRHTCNTYEHPFYIKLKSYYISYGKFADMYSCKEIKLISNVKMPIIIVRGLRWVVWVLLTEICSCFNPLYNGNPKRVIWQTEKIQMKCSSMLHFIRAALFSKI